MLTLFVITFYLFVCFEFDFYVHDIRSAILNFGNEWMSHKSKKNWKNPLTYKLAQYQVLRCFKWIYMIVLCDFLLTVSGCKIILFKCFKMKGQKSYFTVLLLVYCFQSGANFKNILKQVFYAVKALFKSGLNILNSFGWII